MAGQKQHHIVNQAYLSLFRDPAAANDSTIWMADLKKFRIVKSQPASVAMHGGKGGAPRGEGNGNYIHGRCTIEAREMERHARLERRELRELVKELNGLAPRSI